MLAATESANVLLGDHADHVVGPRHAAAADHDSHGAAAAPHPADRVEHDVVLARDREVGPGDGADVMPA
jgi:hypothetical protein